MKDYSEPINRRTFVRRAGLGIVGIGLLGSGGLLAGCGGQGGGSQGGGGEDGIGAYSNKSLDFFFFSAQAAAVRKKIEDLGYRYQTTNAEFDATQQTNDFQSLLLQTPAFLISDPIDSEGLAQAMQRYAQKNVPIGIIDTPITDGEVQFQIAFDNFQGGEFAARRIVEEIRKAYGEESGRVLNCYGALSSSAWRARKEGFDAEMEKYPDIEVIERPTEGLEETTRSVSAQAFSQFPDIRGAHAPSDSLTRGILRTLKATDRLRQRGEDGHVIVTSIDGEPQSLEWARQGWLDAEVSQDPIAYGEICVEMIVNRVLQDKDVPVGDYTNDRYAWETAEVLEENTGPNMVIPAYYVDGGNVDDPRQWGNRIVEEYDMKQDATL